MCFHRAEPHAQTDRYVSRIRDETVKPGWSVAGTAIPDSAVPANSEQSSQAFLVELQVTSAASRVQVSAAYNKTDTTRMWANAQPDGRPAEHRLSLIHI